MFVHPIRVKRPRVSAVARCAACCIVAVGACTATAQSTQTISLSGSDGDGYLATVGLNQEGNQTLDNISRDPMDAKFFDYPAYVNPNIPENIFIMYVEPYRFGLTYPDPLHPSGPGVFQPVGPLRPASEASLPGVTFIEAARVSNS